MDDFFEDQQERAAAAPVQGKRKRIKTVERVYQDEKGFLVTALVEEEVTDDEADLPKPKPKPISPVKKAKLADDEEGGKAKPKPKAAAAKGKAAPAAGAKLMTSFFGKRA